VGDATVDRTALHEQLGQTWLEGLSGAEREEGERLLAEIVDDWVREASSTPDPSAVLAIQKRELEERAPGGGPAERLQALRRRAVERRIDHLDTAAFALGKDVLAGSADDEEARSRGREYLDRAEALSGELDRLGAPAGDPARRALGDAVLDALYAVERKAMSPRLAREGGGGAPDVRA
jgi:hypothetical protein